MADKLGCGLGRNGRQAVQVIVCLAGGHARHAVRCKDNLAQEGGICKKRKHPNFQPRHTRNTRKNPPSPRPWRTGAGVQTADQRRWTQISRETALRGTRVAAVRLYGYAYSLCDYAGPVYDPFRPARRRWRVDREPPPASWGGVEIWRAEGGRWWREQQKFGEQKAERRGTAGRARGEL